MPPAFGLAVDSVDAVFSGGNGFNNHGLNLHAAGGVLKGRSSKAGTGAELSPLNPSMCKVGQHSEAETLESWAAVSIQFFLVSSFRSA